MKIILFVSFCLILGQVGCSDVIGYVGGSVIIYCNDPPELNAVFFCKDSQCTYSNTAQEAWFTEGRISVTDSPRGPKMILRQLTLQDAGLYVCGVNGQWNRTVNLKVHEDPAITGPTTVITTQGQTATITCAYPEEFKKTNMKRFYRQNGQYGQFFTEVVSVKEPNKDRFSMTEDKSTKAVSVTISNVSKEDATVYYCSVWMRSGQVLYISHFKETKLLVNDAA